MDGVLEELVDEGGQGGCRVLGDDRPSEEKFNADANWSTCGGPEFHHQQCDEQVHN